jgi:hypothetical protein
MEEMLIALVLPVMKCYRHAGGQSRMKGHCCNIWQDIAAPFETLPRDVSSLPVFFSVKPGCKATDIDIKRYKVRRDAVLTWLQWLQQHNPNYSVDKVKIDLEVIARLPRDGVPDDITTTAKSDDGPAAETMNKHPWNQEIVPDDPDLISGSFFPTFISLPLRTSTTNTTLSRYVHR